MGLGAAAPQSDWGATHCRIHHHVQGLPRDGAAHGPLPADLQWASLVRGEAAQNRAGWGICLAEEAKVIGPLPYVLPL